MSLLIGLLAFLYINFLLGGQGYVALRIGIEAGSGFLLFFGGALIILCVAADVVFLEIREAQRRRLYGH
jgi:hypothetical protein